MAEDELTPEEKLLKVIQKGDNQEPEKEDAATTSPDKLEGEEITVAATVRDTEKAKTAAKSESESFEDTPASEADYPTVAVSPVVVASTGRSPLRVLNRAMLAVAAVLLCISGVEMWANIRSPLPLITQQPYEIAAESVDSENFIADLSDTLDMYSKRRIFGKPDPVVIKESAVKAPELAGWRAYARKNYNLMGLSMVSKQAEDGSDKKIREAIVVDKKTGNMHFLSIDQTIVIEKQTVKINNITDSSVTFLKGDEEVILE